MFKTILIFDCAAILFLLCALPIRAQNTDSDSGREVSQSATPNTPLLSWASDSETPMDSEQLAPDQRPLTGVQGLTLGQYSEPHSFLLPSVNVNTQLETNPANSGDHRVSTLTYLLGRIDLHRVSGRSALDLEYAGGGMLSTYGSNGNAAIQDVEFSTAIHGQRWSLFLGDEASYLSESPFGFGGVGGLGFLGGISQSGPGGGLGGSLPFLSTALVPSETIPTGNVPRLSNTAVSQIEYRLSPRSSWTAAASYGLLQFFGAGFINSTNILLQTGYNYQVSPMNSVAVLYRFDAFRFTNLWEGIDDNLIQLSYGRRITGRMSFQIAAGPEMDIFRTSPAGPPTQISWTLGTSFNYQLGATALSLTYDHLLTAGSGVLVGAETNQAQGSADRILSRTWKVLASLGYARNQGLEQTSVGMVQPLFNSWYGAVQVNHQLRPGATVFFAIGARREGINSSACAALNCRASYMTQQFSLGFNWGLSPIHLQ
jgi:hypothetical protein